MPAEIIPGVTADLTRAFGKPVIAGTRIPVALILGQLAAGVSERELRDEYELTAAQVRAVLQYGAWLAEHACFPYGRVVATGRNSLSWLKDMTPLDARDVGLRGATDEDVFAHALHGAQILISGMWILQIRRGQAKAVDSGCGTAALPGVEVRSVVASGGAVAGVILGRTDTEFGGQVFVGALAREGQLSTAMKGLPACS